jgi:predicted AAA+ superfamily ATPase
MNAQILNIENLARESFIGRTTIDKYFQVLEDTLIGSRLPALREGAKTKEISHPKFFFFDSGVSRACAGALNDPIDSVARGFAFETLLFSELRAYNHYAGKNRDLFFYQIGGSYDIDFVIETRKKTMSTPRELLLVSVKSAKQWDRKWNTPLLDFKKSATSTVGKMIGIYRGDRMLTHGPVQIFPVESFLDALYAGKIF